MTNYIATFFSHFGATRFKKQWEEQGYAAKATPVPRSLSSSCGTCVIYEADKPLPDGAKMSEIDGVYVINEDETYTKVDL